MRVSRRVSPPPVGPTCFFASAALAPTRWLAEPAGSQGHPPLIFFPFAKPGACFSDIFLWIVSCGKKYEIDRS